MADHRGVYAPVAHSEASFISPGLDSRFSKTSRFLAIIHPAPQKRRVILSLGGAVLIFLAILVHQTTFNTVTRCQTGKHLDTVHLDHLAAPLLGYDSSTVNNETSFIVGEHHAVSGNYPRDYQWVDPYSRKPFNKIVWTNGMNNNAMGRMPAGSPYDMLVVARGRSDRYMDPTEHIPYMNLTIVGFFANFNATKGEWERAGPEPYVLDLPVWRQFPRPCPNLVNGGAADPRFIWSDAGEPLAVIGTSSRVQDVCKAVGLVDLRAAWPGLKEHLDEIGYGDIPIKFDTFTEIGRADIKQEYEKNWAPFFPGPKPVTRELSWLASLSGSWRTRLADSTWPLFASQITPRSIVKVNETLDTSSRSPDSMFVTMSTEAPFDIFSVSPPLHFGSVEIDNDVVFSVSMAFLPTKSAADLAIGESPFKESQDTPGGYLGHGWLDDTIVVGAGLRDAVYDSIHLPMAAALRGHTVCSRIESQEISD
ncbi:hypothetical protein FZEAL_2571 [Fusarium zealandicum]|uniref:Uncharacterized protein n=1 Tax=Fusarium zealandicum TaxID=1053134 RepID=A0A8H4UR92_9HYPO|nr:hypothetical protein FZEAL_2571 [Fusarium zealandicum]